MKRAKEEGKAEVLVAKNNKNDQKKIRGRLRRRLENNSAIIILLAISSLLITSIVVPVIITAYRVVRMQPLTEQEPVVTLTSPKQEYQLNIKDIENLANFYQDEETKVKELKLVSEAIKYLYQQELIYTSEGLALLNQINQSLFPNNPPLLTNPLRSIEEIELAVKSTLEEKKRQLQTNFGIENWPLEFAKELQKPEYGGASSEAEAILFKVNEELSQTAFASTKLEINQDFSSPYKALITLKDDVLVRDSSGERILFKRGEAVRLDFLKNAFTSLSNNQTPTSRLTAILAKTANFKEKDKFVAFRDFLAKKQDFFWYFSLPIKLERTLNDFKFKISPNDLIKLLTMIPTEVAVDSKEELKFSNLKSLLEIAFDISANIPKKSLVKANLDIAKTKEGIENDLLLEIVSDILEESKPKEEEQTNNLEERVYSPIKERLTKRYFGYESSDWRELSSSFPELLPLKLNHIFKAKELTKTLFSELTSELLGSLNIKFSATKEFSFLEIDSLNKRIKEAILEKEASYLEDLLDRFLKAKLATKKANNSSLFLSNIFSFNLVANLKMLPTTDYLILFQALDQKNLEQVLANQLSRSNQQKKVEQLDLTSLFLEYDQEYGRDRILIKLLKDQNFRESLITKSATNSKTKNERFKVEDFENLIKSLKLQRDNLDNTKLSTLRDSINTKLLTSEWLTNNLDFDLNEGREAILRGILSQFEGVQ